MPHTLQDIEKEIAQIQSTVDALPNDVFRTMDIGKSNPNDLKVAALMYAPDHSLLYLCGLINRADAELCQGEFREMQKLSPVSADKTFDFAKPYFKRIEELSPHFCELFARLQDSDLDLAPPVKNKFMKDIKNLRRAAALYELTFLNMHGLKYDLNDILPALKWAEPLNALDENFNLLWHTAMVLGALKGKHNKAHALLGLLTVKHFCAAADAFCDVQEDAFNPGVRLKTREMASYFKGLMPQTIVLNDLQMRSVMVALTKQVRTVLSMQTHEPDWRRYLTSWYDSCTRVFIARQPKTVLNGSIFNKIKLGADFKKRTR